MKEYFSQNLVFFILSISILSVVLWVIFISVFIKNRKIQLETEKKIFGILKNLQKKQTSTDKTQIAIESSRIQANQEFLQINKKIFHFGRLLEEYRVDQEKEAQWKDLEKSITSTTKPTIKL